MEKSKGTGQDSKAFHLMSCDEPALCPWLSSGAGAVCGSRSAVLEFLPSRCHGAWPAVDRKARYKASRAIGPFLGLTSFPQWGCIKERTVVSSRWPEGSRSRGAGVLGL
ncbi:hypothetical protein SRHO_G00041830 [Serrasalmus rhombeus]